MYYYIRVLTSLICVSTSHIHVLTSLQETCLQIVLLCLQVSDKRKMEGDNSALLEKFSKLLLNKGSIFSFSVKLNNFNFTMNHGKKRRNWEASEEEEICEPLYEEAE